MPSTFEKAQLQEYAAKFTSRQSHVSIVGDPASGVRYVIDSLYIGGDADGSLQLEDSTGAAIAGYFFVFGANIPCQISEAFLKKATLSKGLKLTTTGGGNHAVVIKFHPAADGAP